MDGTEGQKKIDETVAGKIRYAKQVKSWQDLKAI